MANLRQSHRVQRYTGKYRGTVINNVDPEQLGRIQAAVPDVLGGTPSAWANPAAPFAGSGVGFFAIPPVGANVWVEFEGGDPDRPVWVGGWWNQGEVPRDATGAGGLQALKLLKTESGLTLTLDDSSQTIVISGADGSTRIQVNMIQGTVELRGSLRLVLQAPRVQIGGEAAASPAVLGDQLLAYLEQLVTLFNAHVHASSSGVTSPPTPTLPPPAPGLLSPTVALE